jgi:hypothetical protein
MGEICNTRVKNKKHIHSFDWETYRQDTAEDAMVTLNLKGTGCEVRDRIWRDPVAGSCEYDCLFSLSKPSGNYVYHLL